MAGYHEGHKKAGEGKSVVCVWPGEKRAVAPPSSPPTDNKPILPSRHLVFY